MAVVRTPHVRGRPVSQASQQATAPYTANPARSDEVQIQVEKLPTDQQETTQHSQKTANPAISDEVQIQVEKLPTDQQETTANPSTQDTLPTQADVSNR